MVDGDLMCLECGSSPAQAMSYDAQPDSSEPEAPTQTLIDGWRLIRQISSTDG
ncbi:serine/threonine protein kinase, partial [Pseudomonas syringae pv. actinidiae ICMP 19070]